MAMIGTLGDIVFSVSGETVKTFDNLSVETAARYYKHDRHLNKPLLEFGGMDNDKLSFDMHHSVFLGVNPNEQIKRIDEYMSQGTVLTLIIGGKKYGSKWVIVKHSKDFARLDGKGRVLIANSKVSLEEYPNR